MTTEELQAKLTAVEAERDTLLKRHRDVCKACQMLGSDPTATIEDFLAKHSTKKPK